MPNRWGVFLTRAQARFLIRVLEELVTPELVGGARRAAQEVWNKLPHEWAALKEKRVLEEPKP